LATKDDILQALIKQTESGEMQWHTTNSGWSVSKGHRRSEMVLTNGHWLYSYPGEEYDRVPIPQAESLHQLLQQNFPAAQQSDDEALRTGLECLLGDDRR
jgi:hypothetical protein